MISRSIGALKNYMEKEGDIDVYRTYFNHIQGDFFEDLVLERSCLRIAKSPVFYYYSEQRCVLFVLQ